MDSTRRGSSVVFRSRRRLLRVVFGCALFWLAEVACSARAADVEPRAAALAVDADASCIDAVVLRGRVASKDWRWIGPAEERAALSLVAIVRAQGVGSSELMVRLQLRWPDGRSAQRTLAAHSCEAALDALALLIQMTLDAENRPREPAVGPGQDAAGAPESSSFVERVALGVSVGLGTAAAPALQPGLGVYAALGLQGSGLVQPWLQLEFLQAWRSGIAVADGSADFALTGGQLLACPVGVRSAGLAAHGCGAFELARLWARGADVYEPRAVARAWASAGLGVLLHAMPVSWLELQLGAALLRPLWRDQFSFAPDVFYAVPAWRWQIKLGLGVCFL